MPAEARGRCLALLLLLTSAIAVHGTPSIPSLSTTTATATLTRNPASQIRLSPTPGSLYDSLCPDLARIGREILAPPIEVSTRRTVETRAKSLPGVPAGVFMVIVGFLCVSFVNDRRVWLASLAGILWLGQTGLAAIPQAASNMVSGRNSAQQRTDNNIAATRADRRKRLRSDVEGTQYIALLRHLAGIPALVSSSIPASLSSLRAMQSSCHAPARVATANARFVQATEYVVARIAWTMINQIVRSVCATEFSVRFTPGFVFSNLARGPPKLH